MRGDVTTRKHCFNVLQELRVNSHHVLEVAVCGTILHHPDFAVPFYDLCFYLSDLLREQHAHVPLAVEYFTSRLSHAVRAKRVGRARPTQCWLGLLPGFQERLIRPAWCKRRARTNLVDSSEHSPSAASSDGQSFLHVLSKCAHVTS